MASDSIIAKPTNRVRVMVAEASGCCARELRATATARPSPSAGHMQPMPMVRPDVTMEAIAIRVLLSMGIAFCAAAAGGGRDVHRGENTEDVGLHHAGEQTESRHDNRKQVGGDRKQNA